ELSRRTSLPSRTVPTRRRYTAGCGGARRRYRCVVESCGRSVPLCRPALTSWSPRGRWTVARGCGTVPGRLGPAHSAWPDCPQRGGIRRVGEGWRIRLLGPLEIRHDGVLVPVAAAKQRVLIAALALAGGEPVTVDRLVTYLWDDRPPASARNTLQNYVLRLRGALRIDDEPDPVVTSAAGYHLEVDA